MSKIFQQLCKPVAAKNKGNSTKETELAQLRAQLEELTRRNEELSRDIQTREKFLPLVNHELRTPLNSILGFTELLQVADNPSMREEYTHSIQVAALDLLGIISNIVDHASIAHLQAAPGYFDFPAFLEDLVFPVRTQAQHKGITFRLEKDFPHQCLLHTDSGHLRTILHNLLQNAVRFTDTGGIIMRVKREQTGTRGHDSLFRIRVEIEDDGIGIPPKEREKVFLPLYQVEYPERGTQGGIGLGLSVARQLAELLGGSLTYSPREQGSTFVFEFTCPGIGGSAALQKRAPQLSSATTPLTKSFYQLHILIVEDNAVNVRLLEIILGRMGHTCHVVRDGQAALTALQSHTFDLILMDVQMPIMNGETATKEIRRGAAGASNRTIPIVALTAYAQMQDRKRFIAAGMTHYLSKPLQSRQLRSILTEIAHTLNKESRPK